MAAPAFCGERFLNMRGAATALILLQAGCAQNGLQAAAQPGERNRSAGDSVASFDPKQIGKSDIDRVADVHRREVFASLRVLAEKLYRRNPREWKKGGHASVEAALDRLLDLRNGWRLPEAGGKSGTEAILLDAQKLYNSARNLEIAAWKLANARDGGGALLLLSNETGQGGQAANLSFEREFGKMIGNLDLLSSVVADKGHRTIARVAQSLATAVFLPVMALR
ncbi:MAG: hypothetical protein NT083_05695 [Rhodocyclales bacterium]|nr:hypothetical protein [Rhodocyclales bacterium]